MTLKEYLTTYDLMAAGDISSFSFLSTDRVATMKSHLLFRYGNREIDFDDDVTISTCQNVFTALVKVFMQVNDYRYTKLYNTITASYSVNQTHKTTHSGSDTTTLTAGTTMTTTPNNYKTQHKDRTYDNDTLEATSEDVQSGSTATTGSGSDTNTTAYGHIITEDGDPIDQLEKERKIADFNFIDLMCSELANYVCLQNWLV